MIVKSFNLMYNGIKIHIINLKGGFNMAFLDNIGKKMGEAAKKSGELVEVSKINISIGNEEGKIQNLYKEIGQNLYQKYVASNECDEDFRQTCETINQHEQTIKELKQKILEIKNIKICPNCNAEIARNIQFCSGCGAKQEEMPQEEVETEVETKTCASCNTVVNTDVVFCSGCGTKFE